jgi:hypothetical protein
MDPSDFKIKIRLYSFNKGGKKDICMDREKYFILNFIFYAGPLWPGVG